MFSRGMTREHWPEMGQRNQTYFSVPVIVLT